VDTLALIKFQAGNPAVGMTAEISVPDIKRDQPWIGENPIGDWYYAPGYYYDAINLVRSLLEYASRNGSYACAVPIDPEGGLEPDCVSMLKNMGEWMKINGEGIYDSSAWLVWGEGPGGTASRVHKSSLNKKSATDPYSTGDFRFTLGSDGTLYAWCLAIPKPNEVLKIAALGSQSKHLNRPIKSVQILGGPQLTWKQEPDGLRLTCPDKMPYRYAVGFKVTF